MCLGGGPPDCSSVSCSDAGMGRFCPKCNECTDMGNELPDCKGGGPKCHKLKHSDCDEESSAFCSKCGKCANEKITMCRGGGPNCEKAKCDGHIEPFCSKCGVCKN